jgi:hypothetical protein
MIPRTCLWIPAVGAALSVLFVSSCDRPSGPVPIVDVRTLTEPRPAPPLKMSSAQRFGLATAANPAPAVPAVPSFEWNAPEGWKRGRESQTRLISYLAGQNGEAECYVSVLPDMAGGLEANVNRWAKQMNCAPLSAEAIAALPTVHFLGEPAPLIELAGNFADSMSGKNIADALLLGVVAQGSAGSVFIKMVGPAETVRAQKDNFVAFCESFRNAGPNTG